MNKILVVFISLIVGFGSAQLALAKKPDDAGGKSAMKEHKSEMKEMHKGDRDDDFDDDEKKIKDKAKKERGRDHDDGAGLAKQREKKAEQERKELGKGSEQGQASREEHSRKWWKFWE